MADRLDALYAELDRVVPHLRGSTVDRLRSLFAIHMNFESSRVRLFLAHIAAAFDWNSNPDSRPYGRTPRLREVIRSCVAEGVERGDVSPSVDLDGVVEALLGVYAWTYRLVAWENADVTRLGAVFDAQVGLIAEGFRPRN
jgi:hypothetical protein